MKQVRMITAVAAVFFVLALPAFAQQRSAPGVAPGGYFDERDPEDGPDDRGNVSEERREEIRKKIQAVRIYRLTETLKLAPQTSVKLAALLGSLDQERAAIMQEQKAAFRTLREQLAPSQTPDEKALRKALHSLERKHRAMADLREREWRELKKLLSVEQQARYVLFHREFMREIRGRMAGARRGGAGQGMRQRQGPGPGTGRPQW